MDKLYEQVVVRAEPVEAVGINSSNSVVLDVSSTVNSSLVPPDVKDVEV